MNIENLSTTLQRWINPQLNFKPRYIGYKEVDGELQRVEYSQPKFDVRLKFSSIDLASKWADEFRNCMLGLSGTGDYITIMHDNKPFHLTFASNITRKTGEIKNIVTFTFVEPSVVISEVPAMVEADEVPAGL